MWSNLQKINCIIRVTKEIHKLFFLFYITVNKCQDKITHYCPKICFSTIPTIKSQPTKKLVIIFVIYYVHFLKVKLGRLNELLHEYNALIDTA
jgi:hypothetical protein